MEFKKTTRRTRPLQAPASRSTPLPRSHIERPIAATRDGDQTQSPKSSTSSRRSTTTSLLSNKKFLSVVAGIICIMLIIVVTTSFHKQAQKNNAPASDPKKISETFEKQTVSPGGKSVEQLGGWKRVSPPTSDPVFAYNDTIAGVAISVSQQPLPDSFKGNVDGQVADLAKKFSATATIGGTDTKAYIGNSSKGPQSVILTKNSVLILIKSQQKITDKDWAAYITSLK